MWPYLKTWKFLALLLAIGALAPGPFSGPAFAEEELSPAELDRIRAWHEIYLNPAPVFADTEKHFVGTRYYSKEEIRAQGQFYRLPQTKKIVDEARRDLIAYVDQLAAGAGKASGFGRQIPADAGADMLLSYQQFQEEQGRARKKITEPEAERLARYQLEQRYGRLDLQDPNQRREFQRETNRYLLTGESARSAPRMSEGDFNEWRLRELGRLKAAREANMEKFAALSLEFDPEGLRIAKPALDGTLSTPALRALTAAELEGAKFFYRPIALRPQQIIRLTGDEKTATAWFIRLKGGEEFGLAHKTGGAVQAKLAPPAKFSIDEFFQAEEGRRERIFAFHAAAGAESAFEDLSAKVSQKFKFRPDSREMEAMVKTAASEVKSAKARFFEPMRWDSHLLFVRGLLQDPLFWKKRDAKARELGAKAFPLGRDTPPKVGFFSAWSGRDRGGGGGRPDFSGLRSSLSLSGDPLSPENTAREVQAASDQITLFKTDKIIPGKGPGFYSLFDSTKISEAERVEALVGRPSLSVSSGRAFQPRAGLLAIPSPEGHELARLEVKTHDGKLLEAGRDYELLKGKDGYVLRMSATDELYGFRAGFAPKKGVPKISPAFSSLDKYRLIKLRGELANAQLFSLAKGLDALLEKEKVSLFDLERLFRSESLYSFNPEPNIPERVGAASGPFKSYANFANAEGKACFQCDGSNSLFRDFLQAYFGDQAKVRSVSGFQSGYRSLKESHLHQITMVEADGFSPLKLDATPVRMDRSVPGAGERIVAQQTKLASEPVRPKPVYVENFRRELEDAKNKFLKVAEPSGLKFNKGDPWLNVGKATAVLDAYLGGTLSLKEAGSELERFLPGRKIEFATHEDFMRSLSALAREERETLAKGQIYAREHPHVPGGTGYRSSAIVSSTDRRLELLAKAEEYVTEANFAEYRAASAVPRAGDCSGMFGALGK